VLVADDPTIVRNVRVALRYAAGCRVAATVDGRYAARSWLSELRPDVVLVDEMCQRSNSFARLREAREAVPGARTVLLCDSMEHALLGRGIASGAHAVVSRRIHPSALGTLLVAVAESVPACAAPVPAQWPAELARTSA
jgi:DNA-binding NarL/FixJ family response regulator